METKFDATQQQAHLNWKQVGAIIVFVASVVWTLSGIYFRFMHVESNREIDLERIEYVNKRIDKKFDQLKLYVDEKHK